MDGNLEGMDCLQLQFTRGPLRERVVKNYSEKEIRCIFPPWIDPDPKIALTRSLLQGNCGSFLKSLLASKGVQCGQTSGPVTVWSMLQANRTRYNSENWHSSAERAALVEAGQSRREQLAEARARFAAVQGQHQPKSAPWSEEYLSGRQSACLVKRLYLVERYSMRQGCRNRVLVRLAKVVYNAHEMPTLPRRLVRTEDRRSRPLVSPSSPWKALQCRFRATEVSVPCSVRL